MRERINSWAAEHPVAGFPYQALRAANRAFRKTFWVQILFVISNQKRIESKLLNYLGVQPLRAYAAHLLRRLRKHRFPEAKYTTELETRGMLVLENYLDPKTFEELKTEYYKLIPTAQVRQIKGARFEVKFLSGVDPKKFPGLHAFINDRLLLDLATANQAQELTVEDMSFHLHRVSTLQEQTDQNQVAHTDTFHYTTKGWLFLHDVGEKEGPFCYAPESHRISPWRLKLEYTKSIGPFAKEQNGSWRLTEEELSRANIAVRSFPVKANTLVLANTCGFHRRGEAPAGLVRDSIHFSSRVSPFFSKKFYTID